MKVQVNRRDGRIETLNLVGELVCREASSGGQGSISVIATKYTHFFSEDGLYDGWEVDVSDGDITLEAAFALADAVEADRQIENL